MTITIVARFQLPLKATTSMPTFGHFEMSKGIFITFLDFLTYIWGEIALFGGIFKLRSLAWDGGLKTASQPWFWFRTKLDRICNYKSPKNWLYQVKLVNSLYFHGIFEIRDCDFAELKHKVFNKRKKSLIALLIVPSLPKNHLKEILILLTFIDMAAIFV